MISRARRHAASHLYLTQCISQTVLESELPHIIGNLWFAIGYENNELTVLWGS